IIELHDVQEGIAMLRTPDGEATVELAKFYSPSDEKGVQRLSGNTLSSRHIAFENTYKLCYIRGPEEIILELAKKLK
ncbi:MAG: VOC family protein, partial [Thermomicrobiales bacterium]